MADNSGGVSGAVVNGGFGFVAVVVVVQLGISYLLVVGEGGSPVQSAFLSRGPLQVPDVVVIAGQSQHPQHHTTTHM